MKCPLLKGSTDRYGGIEITPANDCLKDECAWWDNQDKRCVLATIAGCHKTIIGWLGEIANTMPHAGQFTK